MGGLARLQDLSSRPGNPAGVSQHGQSRSFAFDWLGRMTSETAPESGTSTLTFGFDSIGMGSLVKVALHEAWHLVRLYCGNSAGAHIVKSIPIGAGVGAAVGGYAGFAGGEVLGGEVTLGFTGIPGAALGAYIGAHL